MRRWGLTAALTLLLGSAGCGGDEETRTVTVENREAVEDLKGLAYREMKRLSRRTCAAVPRAELAKALLAASSDPAVAGASTNNDIALLFAEDVRIQDIRLQQAAYDGCIEGLKRNPP